MAYTLVPTELIQDGAVTSAKLDTNIAISGTLSVGGVTTLATHLVMGDNDKIKIGTGGDLEIYHDASNSYIANSTGNLYIGDTNGSVHIQAKLNEDSIVAAADGAVTLYYDNAAKLATSSAGVTVTGALAATLSTAAQPNITSVGTLTALTGGTGDLNWDSGTLFVDSSANFVGIGTTSPTSPLHITASHPTVYLETSGGGATDAAYLQKYSNDVYLYNKESAGNLYLGTNNATKVTLDSSGNVGIGATPTATSNVTTLEVSNATTARILVDSTGTGGRKYGWYSSTDGQFAVYDYDASAERMRIDSSGNVGIGISSGIDEKLHIKNGALKIEHDSHPVIYLEDVGNSTSQIGVTGSGAGTDGVYIAGYAAVAAGTYDFKITGSNGSIQTRSTINPAGGIQLGGTGAANKLDDYEEGTWTATTTGGGTFTIGTNSCLYTKIGRQVTAKFNITFSAASGNTAFITIGGLPFGVANISANYGANPALVDNLASATGVYLVQTGINSTSMIFITSTGGTAGHNGLAGNQITTNTTLRGTVVYFTA